MTLLQYTCTILYVSLVFSVIHPSSLDQLEDIVCLPHGLNESIWFSMVSIIEIRRESWSRKDNHTTFDYKWLSSGVLITPEWIVTSFRYHPDVTKTVAQWTNIKFDKSKPRTNIANIVYYPSDAINLVLVKVKQPFPMTDAGVNLWTQLPKREEYTRKCKTVILVGYPASDQEEWIACMNGRILQPVSTTTAAHCNLSIGLTAMKESVHVCFDDAMKMDLTTTMGGVMFCSDNNENVLIGVTKGHQKAEAVGMFTKWIAETTGLNVSYKSSPMIIDRATNVSNVTTANSSVYHVEGYLWAVFVLPVTILGWCNK